jgi:hypothetical protein
MTLEEFMMEFYREENTHARHTEMQRLEVTKFLLAAAAALLGVMGALKFSIHCVPLALGMMYLGWFGQRMLEVHASRFDDHRKRARAARRFVDHTVGQNELGKIIDKYPIDKSVGRVRHFWESINRALIVFGFLCLCWILMTVVVRSSCRPEGFWKSLQGQIVGCGGQ